jgi:hypothetical protein
MRHRDGRQDRLLFTFRAFPQAPRTKIEKDEEKDEKQHDKGDVSEQAVV